MTVGEVYLFDPARLVEYYGSRGDELHLAFNFMFLRSPWRAAAFCSLVETFERLLPPGAWPDYTLGNHDSPRVASRYDEGGRGDARARLAAMLLLTLRGTPFLYNGEEIGMRDGPIPPDRVVDVHGRDPERTPMQWGSGPGAGFTTGDPWLPIAPSAEAINVERQRDDPASMLSLQRRLITYRRGSDALRWGRYQTIATSEPDVYAFERQAEGERLVIVLSFISRPLRIDLGSIGTIASDEISTDATRVPGGRVELADIDLGPDEGRILRIR
jgi:alpha-glucosidase